jgi:hypothetical protein
VSFVIAKQGLYGARYVVTAIKQGGLRLDNVRVEEARALSSVWQARTFATRKAADKALERLATVGGYDDYFVVDAAV